MRLAKVTLCVSLTAITALILAGWTGQDAAHPCLPSLGCAAWQLPAPVRITAGHVSYRIARNGGVGRTSPPRSAYPPDAIEFPATATWYRILRGHLVVGRGRTSVWRSRAKIAALQLGVVVAGRSGVAFQHDHQLFIAPPGAAERPIARRELPLGWTTSGLYTYSYPRHALLLRGDGGGLLATIARRPYEYQYDLAARSLYFLTHGVLMSARGAVTRRVASLRSIHMSHNTWFQPLGDGLVELLDDARLDVVRPDGSLFAATPVRRIDRISSLLVTAPGGGAVAFAGLTGPPNHPNAENVYLLQVGAHSARSVHRELGSFGGCVEGANLEWNGLWLLYSNSNGNLAIIDTAEGHRTIELSGPAHHLLGARQGFAAQWTR